MIRKALSSALKLVLAAALLSGCVMPEAAPVSPGRAPAPAAFDADLAARNFVSVIDRVEPVAEAMCLQARRDGNCNFSFFVDPNPAQPPNAAQTLDEAGRPAIIFTIALLAEARNTDELAFILGHEAAHHIGGHISRAQEDAMTGAVVFGVLAALGGADQTGVDRAQQMGAAVGARRFSKDHELEADALGARIAHAAGYDPLRGAEFFSRTPDPGNHFLGSHPPNADRIAVVQREMARIRAGF